ncbi:type II secretion system F family protein [Candidatus Altiarchaeota archaeon]
MEEQGNTGKRMTSVGFALSTVVASVVKLVMNAVNIILMAILLFFRIISRTIRKIMVYVPHLIGRFIPKNIEVSIDQYLTYAGVEMTPEEVIGMTLVYSSVLTMVAYLITIIFTASVFVTWMVIIITFISIWMLPYIALSILVNRRAESVEETLPDVLNMVSQNMIAGMTSYNALWSAARTEFGPLAEEIQGVARSTLTGIPLTDAMLGMTNHIKSDKLSRSIRLIIQGMISGGDLPDVLQGISKDMRKEYNLKKQMASETNAHALFIWFAIFVGAPLLFSVSLQFVTIFSTLLSKLNVQDMKEATPAAMISLNQLSITPEFYQFYAIAILFISGFFAAFLIGILKTGKPVSGTPSVPMMTLGPIAVFLAMKYVLDSFFSSLFIM